MGKNIKHNLKKFLFRIGSGISSEAKNDTPSDLGCFAYSNLKRRGN
ncbi:MAG: hypothetical protein RBS91_07125 [Sulfurimonadaceae bacterium]|jgi:hypothetical protein|nr:hypothetical protein [Sulfurimonadaceae bacterium]